MGVTVVRAWPAPLAPLTVRGAHAVRLEHSRRRADREHQRQARREQAERRSEEVVRMARGTTSRGVRVRETG